MTDNENIVDGGFGHNQTDDMTLERACEAAKDEIEGIEIEQTKIDAIMERAKADCASHRDTIGSLKKKARDDYSIEAGALKYVLKRRRQKRRDDAERENLNEAATQQLEQFEMLFDQAA